MSAAGPKLCKTNMGGAIAKFCGKSFRFGSFNDPSSRDRFNAFKAQWEAAGRTITPEMMQDRVDLEVKSTPGWVYFVSGAHDPASLVKIGMTRHENPMWRIKALQSGSPITLNLDLAIWVSDAASMEKHLHAEYSDSREHGEWFRKSGPLLETMKRLSIDNRVYQQGGGHSDGGIYDQALQESVCTSAGDDDSYLALVNSNEHHMHTICEGLSSGKLHPSKLKYPPSKEDRASVDFKQSFEYVTQRLVGEGFLRHENGELALVKMPADPMEKWKSRHESQDKETLTALIRALA